MEDKTKELTETLKEYLDGNDMVYRYVEEVQGFLVFRDEVVPEETVRILIRVMPDGADFIGVFPTRMKPEDLQARREVVRYLNARNETARLGCYDAELNDGLIRYWYHMPLMSGKIPESAFQLGMGLVQGALQTGNEDLKRLINDGVPAERLTVSE